MKHHGFEQMPEKEWEQVKLCIFPKNILAFICYGDFLYQMFLSVKEYLSLVFLWCFSVSRRTSSIYIFWQEVLVAHRDVWRASSSWLFWSWVPLPCVILLPESCGGLVVSLGELSFLYSFHVSSHMSFLNIHSLFQLLNTLGHGKLLNSSAGQRYVSYLCHRWGFCDTFTVQKACNSIEDNKCLLLCKGNFLMFLGLF